MVVVPPLLSLTILADSPQLVILPLVLSSLILMLLNTVKVLLI
jgi:hypothetical protein